jgi:uncharacterized protein YacL
MTQEEFASVVVRLSGLYLIWHGVINIVSWVGARYMVTVAQGTGSGGDETVAAMNQLIESVKLTDLVLNVVGLIVGLYCAFNGKSIMRLLCRRDGVRRTA